MRCASMFCQQMNMDAPGIYSKGLLVCFWVPLLLSRWSGVRGQTPEIIQTPETLSVSAGEEFTLNCILKGSGRPGGVRWYRGPDRNQPAIYTQKDSSPRVTRLVPESPTDFSITISNVRPEDAGTYYCVKYKKTSGTEVEETAGKGTVVSVIGDMTVFIIVAVVCLLLVVLVVSIIYLIIARHQKGKDPTSVRLHESEKTSAATNQEPDPNNVTYADLNFEKAPEKSPRQVVEISQQSEYASIQAAKPPANDENVTYADLDMVHLSKAPKRPAPKPEETSSEYASVQVQGK
uniref:Ig-like domain-containing protein n=1 Tax=Anolis carolinensis TaxID=28377 RepID=A0A803SSS6_ANOCA